MDGAAGSWLPRHTTVRVLDSLIMFWLTLWLVVGGWTAVTIWQLADMGDTISNSGRALGTAAEALGTVGELPVVGDSVSALASDVDVTSTEVSARGQEFKAQFRLLSVLLGLSIVAIPTAPLLLFYLPMRLHRHRERDWLRRSMRGRTDPEELDRYLAERAIWHLSYLDFLSLSRDPLAQSASGRTRALADIELARLSLRRPADD